MTPSENGGGQLNLEFDADRSHTEALAGMAIAESADRVQPWKAVAQGWLRQLPPGVEFTADDLVRDIGLPDEGVNRNNAVGAIFAGASKTGLIRFAGRMRKSQRVTRHANVQRVWVKV